MSCTLVKRLRVRLTVSPAGASTEMTELALELARESSEATLDTEDVLESELDASENIAAENEGWDVAWRVGEKAGRGSTRRIFIKHLPFSAVHQHTPVHNVASVTCSRLVTSARDIHGLLNVRQSTLASSLGSLFLFPICVKNPMIPRRRREWHKVPISLQENSELQYVTTGLPLNNSDRLGGAVLMLGFTVMAHPVVRSLRQQLFLVLMLQLGIDLRSARRLVSVLQCRLQGVRHRFVALRSLGFAFLFPFLLLANVEAPVIPVHDRPKLTVFYARR